MSTFFCCWIKQKKLFNIEVKFIFRPQPSASQIGAPNYQLKLVIIIDKQSFKKFFFTKYSCTILHKFYPENMYNFCFVNSVLKIC